MIPTTFAGGQRYAILDELFDWVDPVAIFDLRQALHGMVNNGLTLITALRDLNTLTCACDAGVMLADGRIAMTLNKDKLRTAARDPPTFERLTIESLQSELQS